MGMGWDGTDGAGRRLREAPSAAATVVKAVAEGTLLAEGTRVLALDRAWRLVHDPADNTRGWARPVPDLCLTCV